MELNILKMKKKDHLNNKTKLKTKERKIIVTLE